MPDHQADQSQLVQSVSPRCLVTFLGRCTSGYGVEYGIEYVDLTQWDKQALDYNAGDQRLRPGSAPQFHLFINCNPYLSPTLTTCF